MELVLSCLAVVLSIVSLVWSVRSSRIQRQAAAVVTNNTSIANVEATLATVPQVLRFHSIEDPEGELERHGVSPAEFAYLLNNFTLGGAYYRTAPDAEAGVAEGSYRHDMCCSPATRRAWPLLRRMITKSPYRDRLDQIFEELDRRCPLEATDHS